VFHCLRSAFFFILILTHQQRVLLVHASEQNAQESAVFLILHPAPLPLAITSVQGWSELWVLIVYK